MCVVHMQQGERVFQWSHMVCATVDTHRGAARRGAWCQVCPWDARPTRPWQASSTPPILPRHESPPAHSTSQAALFSQVYPRGPQRHSADRCLQGRHHGRVLHRELHHPGCGADGGWRVPGLDVRPPTPRDQGSLTSGPTPTQTVALSVPDFQMRGVGWPPLSLHSHKR
jgi:hypothetical protein